MTARLRRREPIALAAGLGLVALAALGVLALVEMATSQTVDPRMRSVAVLVALGAAGLVAVLVRARPRAITLDDFLDMSPAEFERSVADILRREGYHLVHTGGAGDLAADLRGTDRNGLVVVVQCKRWEPSLNVESGEIEKFVGNGQIHHEAGELIFVTSADFSAPARTLAWMHGIRLIDGAQLVLLAAAPPRGTSSS